MAHLKEVMAQMSRIPLRLVPAALAIVFTVLATVTVSAEGGTRPVAPAGGHDATKPAAMMQASDDVSAARVSGLRPRTAVSPIRARASATPAAAPALTREVFGFAKADSLGDTSVGFQTWNFNLLSDVAYFGIHVNPDGSLVQNDSGWAVWQSSTASSFINTAHASGVRVLLSLLFLPTASQNLTTCQALDNGATTISAAAAQLQGADGIDIDYEASNATCPDGVALRTKLVTFVQAVRRANLGYLVIDTFASSAEDGGGFFDIPNLAGSVDAFFVMAYGLEAANGPCPTCMGPTSPFDGASPNYTWNVTRAANGYAPWASQSIMGFPYYGVAGCVQPNPPPNAPVATPSNYAGVPYTVFPTLPSNPVISSYSQSRDALDPLGQESWASYDDADPSLNCWREAYWDDPVSLAHKYNLVNQRGFRGAGIFTLDYGGGSPELWEELSVAFASRTSLGGTLTSSPAVASWGLGRLDVFARGTDNALYHRWFVNGVWSVWESLGGTLTSAPAAVSWGPNRIDVFARGTDNALYHKAFTGTGWTGWDRIGGVLTEAPGVSSWAPGRLDVFVRGTDSAMYHIWGNGASWSGWEAQGGVLASGPGAVSWAANRIDVFVRGTTNAVYHRWWDGTAWRGWESVGGATSGEAPAPAAPASGRLDVFALAQDSTLSHDRWNGASWTGWQGIAGGPWQFGPGAVSQPGSGQEDVFAVASDGSLWHIAA